MAIRPILHYPDPRLRIPGRPVTQFDAELKALVADMAETMYAAPGVGLAATQIGVALRLFIVDTMSGIDAPSELRVFANPRFLHLDGNVQWEEGCLSFPGLHADIKRAERVGVAAQDENGKAFTLEADGLLAIAIQHETDHLEGKLMIDHLNALKRRAAHRAMLKRAHAAGGKGPLGGGIEAGDSRDLG